MSGFGPLSRKCAVGPQSITDPVGLQKPITIQCSMSYPADGTILTLRGGRVKGGICDGTRKRHISSIYRALKYLIRASAAAVAAAAMWVLRCTAGGVPFALYFLFEVVVVALG